MSLEIHLLPEFGWSIQNKTVYGPGSVFQGFVKIHITEAQLIIADRLRIVFHASEQSLCSGSIHPAYHNQLFGSQRTLWKRKDVQSLPTLTANQDITIPFIIQLPMVQFPPSYSTASVKFGLSYNSNYKLSVHLDSQLREKTPILTSWKEIIFMPMLETSISKEPIHITTSERPSSFLLPQHVSSEESPEAAIPSATVRLTSLDYVPGDEMPISVKIRTIPRKSIDCINIKLHQIQTWKKTTPTDTGERYLTNIIGQKVIHLVSTQSNDKRESLSNEIVLDTSLNIPLDSVPTFTYGTVFSITYQLKVSIKRKSKIWSQTWDLPDITIRLGTLGYGIRSFEKINAYSTYDSIFNSQQTSDNTLPTPKFLDCLEYEECLPLYNNERLPDYNSDLCVL
ncbi:hypothetical protein INT47_007680 [Mucor saturninus]|uniref:Arrestin C-terminal-like domain-containing protein n=1 Tax=Mucor saturninus TaxID=64648 RepID=A0A8H7UVB3_9FUNG|nr:hypothetical protein INT47_007680 [Mucor saturninus]